MLKILQARLQQYVNCEIPDVHTAGGSRRPCRGRLLHYQFPACAGLELLQLCVNTAKNGGSTSPELPD